MIFDSHSLLLQLISDINDANEESKQMQKELKIIYQPIVSFLCLELAVNQPQDFISRIFNFSQSITCPKIGGYRIICLLKHKKFRRKESIKKETKHTNKEVQKLTE